MTKEQTDSADSEAEIRRLQESVEEAIERNGDKHVEVSYKLDELSRAQKAGGKLLDAANTAAKARSIRQLHFRAESNAQDEKLEGMSLVEQKPALNIRQFKYCCIAACVLIAFCTALVPNTSAMVSTIKSIVGSSLIGIALILLTSHLKLNRTVKYGVIAAVGGLVWELLSHK